MARNLLLDLLRPFRNLRRTIRIIMIEAPLEGERFITGENPKFRATVKLLNENEDGSQLQWVSDRDGNLGIGGEITIPKLSLGNHSITVSGYGITKTVNIRVFSNLMELYHAEPSLKEINRIKSDFNIIYKDGTPGIADQQWSSYENEPFNPQSPNPSKIVIIAKLDLLRHQLFAKTPPFTNGLSLYEHVKKFTKTVELHLASDFLNHAGGGVIVLNRTISHWIAVTNSGPIKNSDGSYMPWDYTEALQLVIHETRHNDPNSPPHIDCNDWFSGIQQSNIDQNFENGSGFSYACQYYIWVYKYGLFDTPETKTWARNQAWLGLRHSFCTKPTHSDPAMQVIIDELLK
jgi:hypothetical protein